MAAGLLISDAAAVLRITPKAIRTYHARGVVPEPDRDESGYRRYDARALARLARVTRMRRLGLSLREIGELLADPTGAALQARLRTLHERLGAELDDLRARRALVTGLLEQGVEDPLAAGPADVWEELSVQVLHQALPDVTPAQELAERQLARAMAILLPTPEPTGAELEAIDEAMRDATTRAPETLEHFRRFHALADAEPGDPEVPALAEAMRTTVRRAVEDAVAGLPAWEADPDELRRQRVAFEAALEILAPAQRIVLDATFGALFDDQA